LINGTNAYRPLDIFPGTLDVLTISPTSGHLSIILNLIVKTIENKQIPDQTLLLLIDWIHEINAQAENSIELLSKTKEYQGLVASLLICGATTNHKIAIAVGFFIYLKFSFLNLVLYSMK
jgi:PI-3-kinase-related kinase SMG-1